jgi:hypothetical protein
MASNRIKTQQSDAAPVDGPTQALKSLALDAARLQIASCSAAALVFTDWAATAGRLAQAVGDELLQRIDRRTDSHELVTHVVGAANSHLRDLSALPRAAADHLDARIDRASIEI